MRFVPYALKRASRVRLGAAIVVAVVWAASGSALAQSSDYKSLTDAAVEEHSLGHYEEARALFARAHELSPSARTLWGMGVAAFEARQYVDALQLLKAAAADPRKPLTQAQRKQTDSLLERSEAFVVHVPVRVEPRQAKLTIDGRDVQLDEAGSLLLDAGTHQVVASADGFQSIERMMRWSAGTAPVLALRLERQRAESGQPAQAEPSRDDGGPTQAPAREGQGDGRFRVLKWLSLGLSVASLGAMGAGIGLREGAAKHWNNETVCPDPKSDSCPATRRAVATWKTTAIVGAAAAGVFGTLTAVFFVLDRRKPDSSAHARSQCEPAFALGAQCSVRF